MSLRRRLLFQLMPLTIIPLLFLTVIALFLFKHINPISFTVYELGALAVLIGVGIVVIMMSIDTANNVVRPLRAITDRAERISRGEFLKPTRAEPFTSELMTLSEALETMAQSIDVQQQKIKRVAADAAVGQLASHVAHDLASPLSSMETAIEYLKMRSASIGGDAVPYVNLLELSANRLRGIAKDLLDRQRGEEPKRIVFSLHKVLDELVGEYQSQVQYDCAVFVKQYAPRAIFLYGERTNIQRAFGNIIKNALEAMDAVGTITIVTRVEETSATISIQDTGSGMTDELKEQILYGGVSFGKEEGHGIGMSIVCKTIDDHAGSLRCSSEIGVGTTFTLCFPLPASADLKNAEHEDDTPQVFTLTLTRKEPIIIIDDDLSVLEQWRLILERDGVSALVFSSYEDFVAHYVDEGISKTAIVDYHFENSELNGLEVIAKLAEKGFQRIYLCTAEYWKPSIQKRARDLRVELCPKPLPQIRVEMAGQAQVISIFKKESCEEPLVVRRPNVIVIDDDDGIRACWEVMRKKLKIRTLQVFPTMELCERAKIRYETYDIAFIDKHIPESRWALERTIRFLRERGVKRIFIASGEGSEELAKDPVVRMADGITSEKVPRNLAFYMNHPSEDECRI